MKERIDEEIIFDVRKIFAGTNEQKSGQRMRCSANCPSDLMSNDNHQLSIIHLVKVESTETRAKDNEEEKRTEIRQNPFLSFSLSLCLSYSLSRLVSRRSFAGEVFLLRRLESLIFFFSLSLSLI